MRLLRDLERIRKGCVISIYKLQSVSPYCLIKQVNKILGIRNSEIWLFDDVSKIYFPNHKIIDLANLERKKQALAKKADRNANDEDRAPPSLEDLKRRGIVN